MTNYVSALNKHTWVRDQLAQYAGLKITSSDYTLVLCPYHAERTPSGRINHNAAAKSSGWFKCYGCGHSTTWNDVATKLGLKPFKTQKPSDEFLNLSLVSTETFLKDEKFVMEEMRLEPLPENKTWRGIKTSLLTSLGGKKCQVKHPEYGWLKPKIYLPVLVNKRLRGYIKARFTKHQSYPSYINARGGWSKTHGLFPFDTTIALSTYLSKTTGRPKTIVLVEGPRDALRLLQLNIPAVSILGTQSWSDYKIKLLELAGIKRVVLMMDGDDAGIDASEMLISKLENMFRVSVVKLWAIPNSPYLQFKHLTNPTKAAKAAGVSLWDPYSAPISIIDSLRIKYFN